MLPRRPTGPAGLSDRRLAGTQAPSFALVGRRASRNAGANVLGGEIKGEASAAGRRRRTFAPKGIRTRRPAVLRTKRFSLSREKNQEKAAISRLFPLRHGRRRLRQTGLLHHFGGVLLAPLQTGKPSWWERGVQSV